VLARFRLHYGFLWLLLLGFSHWRVGMPRTGLDEMLAGITLLLSVPASFFVAALIAASRVAPQFWDSRAGITLGWGLFFGAGYLQWFVFLPWLVRKIRP
jgi:hypothetical protein